MAKLYNTPNLTDGIDEALVEVAIAVPSFIPMFLIFIFGTVLIGGLIAQRNKTGFGDFPQWTTLASISTLMVALPMTLISGFISLTTLAIVVTITIASGVWLFLDRNKGEV